MTTKHVFSGLAAAVAALLLLWAPVSAAAPSATEDDSTRLQLQETAREQVQALLHVRERVEARHHAALDQALRETWETQTRLMEAERDGKGLATALARMETNAVRHREMLEAMVTGAAALAHEALRNAIRIMEQGQARVQSRLMSLKGVEPRQGRVQGQVVRPSEGRTPGAARPESVPGMGRHGAPDGSMGGGGMRR